MDMLDYEKTQAELKLLSELVRGERSGKDNGYLSVEDVEKGQCAWTDDQRPPLRREGKSR